VVCLVGGGETALAAVRDVSSSSGGKSASQEEAGGRRFAGIFVVEGRKSLEKLAF
jgi:hypothetical protein